MQRKKYTEEQIIQVLKEGEAGAPVSDLCRKYGMSDGSYYNWKAKYRSHRQRIEEAESLGRGESAFKADCRRAVAGYPGAQGITLILPRKD